MTTKECTSCGEEISPKRLKAIPNTELCIECQSEAERNGLHKRHVMDVQPVMKCGEMDEVISTIVRR